MNTDLVKVETALTEFERIEGGLADLRAKFANVVFDVTTPDGMRDAKAARKEIADPRIQAEDIRKDAKAPILALGRQLDAKAKYIKDQILLIEGPIAAQIEAETTRIEREAFAEQQRLIGIQEAILDLERAPVSMAGKTSAEIAARIAALQEYDLTEWAGEMIVPAEKARAGAILALQGLQAGAVAQEAAKAKEEAQRAADAAELASLRAEKQEHVPRGTSGVSASGELASGRALLNAFVTRYGHIPEFKAVADWYEKYKAKLEKQGIAA